MDMFEEADAKDRAKAYGRMVKLAEELKAQVAASNGPDEAKAERVRKFTVEANERAALAWWKHIGKEPVYTAGFLLSPALVAYGRRAVQEHVRGKAEAAKRAEKERGNGGKI